MDFTLSIALLGAGYIALFALERALPLRRPKVRLLPRLVVNVAISAMAFAAAAAIVKPATAGTLDFTAKMSFGLIPLAGLSGALEIVAALLLLDLGFYYWHVANHRIALLWRFHNVHHIDPDLDVSTAFRFHFLEVGFSGAFRALQLIVIGPSLTAFVIYEIAFQLGTLFHHSNVRLPIFLERVLNKVFVTPRMHGIHHSDVREENLSNFGVVFPWWDQLHGTLWLNVPQADVVIGIPGYSQPEDNRLWHALAMPFRRQREYWRTSGGRRLRRNTAAAATEHRLAC
jgi:sterol desaturase/sphingolipid hydroxylase (fatty acid hydroxylase superfamily)